MKNVYMDDATGEFVHVEDVAVFNAEKQQSVFCACGLATSNMQILQSAAGYYIGYAYYDEDMNGWFPYSRHSQEYFRELDAAIFAFETGDYTPKM